MYPGKINKVKNVTDIEKEVADDERLKRGFTENEISS
jgi:hypothetical protein